VLSIAGTCIVIRRRARHCYTAGRISIQPPMLYIRPAEPNSRERMLIRVSHVTTYRYDTPATSVIQTLRLTPRNHEGQFVMNWRIDVSADCRLEQHEAAFGNFAHAFTAEGPFDELRVAVEGEVETRDTQGVVRGGVERFPPSLYLRETPLTQPD